VELGQLIVFMIRGQRRGDLVAVQQFARGARIFRRDQLDFAQDSQRAQRDVFKVANRRRDDVQRIQDRPLARGVCTVEIMLWREGPLSKPPRPSNASPTLTPPEPML